MKKHVFKIVGTDPETEEIFIDGAHISTINHDDQGWSGMDSVRYIVEKIAHELDAEYIYEGF